MIWEQASGEPSYMLFARANVRDNMRSTPTVVRELLARIDRSEKKQRAAVEAMENVRAALDAWLKGERDSDRTLIVIAEVWGRYEGTK